MQQEIRIVFKEPVLDIADLISSHCPLFHERMHAGEHYIYTSEFPTLTNHFHLTPISDPLHNYNNMNIREITKFTPQSVMLYKDYLSQEKIEALKKLTDSLKGILTPFYVRIFGFRPDKTLATETLLYFYDIKSLPAGLETPRQIELNSKIQEILNRQR